MSKYELAEKTLQKQKMKCIVTESVSTNMFQHCGNLTLMMGGGGGGGGGECRERTPVLDQREEERGRDN